MLEFEKADVEVGVGLAGNGRMVFSEKRALSFKELPLTGRTWCLSFHEGFDSSMEEEGGGLEGGAFGWKEEDEDCGREGGGRRGGGGTGGIRLFSIVERGRGEEGVKIII